MTLSHRCPRCLLLRERCLCAELPTLAVRTRIIVVRHCLERFKPSNSARLAALAIPSLTLIDHGLDPAGDPVSELARVIPDGAWLLWPEGPPLPVRPVPPPAALVLLDGSWSQARRMRHRLAPLRRLPCYAVPPSSERRPHRLRRAPGPGWLSTIEALASALAVLGDAPAAAALEALYDELCLRSMPSYRRAGL